MEKLQKKKKKSVLEVHPQDCHIKKCVDLGEESTTKFSKLNIQINNFTY